MRSNPGPRSGDQLQRRRGFWPARDIPAALWLGSAIVVALVHPWVPLPRWLMLHLLLLGAVTHSILVWSRHFAEALLHLPNGDRVIETRRLLLHNAGVLGVIGGQLSGTWTLTLLGAAAVVGAVTWHAADLLRGMRRALPGRFAGTVRHYVAAACFLPVGATLGVLLARSPGDPWHTRMLLSHISINLLGWVGLSVVGTLVTLWPTMLRTRIAPDAEATSARALPVLVGSVALTATLALVGPPRLVAVGLAGYLLGLLLAAQPLVHIARRTPPTAFAPLSVGASYVWLVGSLAALTYGTATADSWPEVASSLGWLVPFFAVGFGAQVLLGALSHLLPVSLGGGARPVRAAERAINSAASLRVTTTNAALLVCALPVPSLVRVLASVVVLVSLGSAIALLGVGIRASWSVQRQPREDRPREAAAPRASAGLAGAGVALVALTVAFGVALDPGAALRGTSASAGVEPTGHTTTVEVVAKDMRFTPDVIEVPAGDRLVVVVVNADASDVHDLALDDGTRTGRLSPGESEQIEVDVVGRDLAGWCTVAGHRQMGMTLDVRVLGGATTALAGGGSDLDSEAGHAGHTMHGDAQGATEEADAADDLDFMASPEDGFRARDAALPPLGSTTVHRRTLTVTEVEREVAPGVTQRLWTFGGEAPGPTLHGRVGDVFEITLVNDGTIGHSIDFHAGALAPDRPMRTIAPGASLTYRFTAQRAGIWMYHCSSMPMSSHIANGMFGAVVIEPEDLPPVDRSYVLVQSEFYLGAPGGEVDAQKVAEERPDAVVFNGYANQYVHDPIRARVGERVRFWVLDAGPNRPTSFHIVGGQFDTMWFEGAYHLRRGSGGAQALGLQAAQGGFVELSFPEAGNYPLVSHLMVDAERGAKGIVAVTE